METNPEAIKEITPKTDEEFAAYQEGERKRVALEILSNAHLPHQFAPVALLEKYLKHPGWSAAFENAKPFILPKVPMGQQGSLVLICGGLGTGKTALAVEVLRYAATLHLGCQFTDLGTYLKRAYTRIVDAELMADFLLPKVLVLDEVNQFGEQSWEAREFSWLIRQRCQDQRHTVMT